MNRLGISIRESLRVKDLIVTDYLNIADEAFSVLGGHLAEAKI